MSLSEHAASIEVEGLVKRLGNVPAVHALLDQMSEQQPALGDVETVLVEAAMQRANGNMSQAARLPLPR